MNKNDEIKKLKEELNIIRRIDKIRDEAVDIKNIFLKLEKEIFRSIPASFCMFFLSGKKGIPKLSHSSFKESSVLKTYCFDAIKKYLKTSWKKKSVIFVSENKEFKKAKIGSIICSPIIPNNEIAGYIAIGTSEDEKDLNPDHIENIRIIIEQIDKGIAYAILNDKLKQTNKELENSIEETKALYKISKELSATIDLPKLLKTVLTECTKLLKVERASILLFDVEGNLQIFVVKGGNIRKISGSIAFKLGEGIAGKAIATEKPYIANDGYKDPLFKKVFTREKHIKNLLCFPLIHRNNKIGVINLVNKLSKEPFKKNDIKKLETISSQICITISNFIMYQDLLQKHEIEKELNVAKTIQTQLLPKGLPILKRKVSECSLTIPAHVVGGDFYDFIIHDRNCLGICIADVSGKGIPAAMVLTVVKNSLHVLANSYISPGKILEKLNNIIASEFQGNMFVTLFYGIFNPKDMSLKFANAGHNYPYLISNKKLETLEAVGLPCGMFDKTNYVNKKITLQKGDKLLLYTDGITEAMNENHLIYGEKRFENNFKNCSHLNCNKIISTIKKDVFKYVGTTPQSDDITMVALEFK